MKHKHTYKSTPKYRICLLCGKMKQPNGKLSTPEYATPLPAGDLTAPVLTKITELYLSLLEQVELFEKYSADQEKADYLLDILLDLYHWVDNDMNYFKPAE